MSDTVYYELVRKVIPATPSGKFRIASAAVWSCQMCGEIIDGMGGPGNGEICEKCGDGILSGTLKYDKNVYLKNLDLRAELGAAEEFKKHYTNLISVNAELMGAHNDGSITDSVVQIEKLVKKLRDERDAVAKRLEKALVEGAKRREEHDDTLRNQAETQSKLDALERMFQMTCQEFEEKRQRILEVLD